MEPACIRHTELPHTSRLFADYLYHFERVARFYAYSPHEAESFRRAAAAIEFPGERRAALAAALEEQNPGSALLEALARPGTVAVVTGQQVGLFSGPCYTIYKALTAVLLARHLSETGLAAVPVFWLATEDHDFEEVRHCAVFDARNQPVRLELPAASTGQPVGGVRIEAAPVAGLRAALEGMPFAEEVAASVERAYAPGTTLGAAFARLLKELLGPHELLLLDPLAPAVRRLAAPALRAAAGRAAELAARVRERNAELEAAGYHAQVRVEPQSSLLFSLEGGRRVPLRLDGGPIAGHAAEDLSPNALLRPVVQDTILPTVAYVGGPAELAYLAQSEVLYRELLGRMPVAVPRQSATLLDARALKLMTRYQLRFEDVLAGEEALRQRLAARLVPPETAAAVRETRERVREPLEALAGHLARFDPTLEEAFGRSRRKIAYQLEKTERKVAREAFRRDERAQAEAAYLSGLVYPAKHLQERFYSIVPFVARHGGGLIDRLAGELKLDCHDHRVIAL